MDLPVPDGLPRRILMPFTRRQHAAATRHVIAAHHADRPAHAQALVRRGLGPDPDAVMARTHAYRRARERAFPTGRTVGIDAARTGHDAFHAALEQAYGAIFNTGLSESSDPSSYPELLATLHDRATRICRAAYGRLRNLAAPDAPVVIDEPDLAAWDAAVERNPGLADAVETCASSLTAAAPASPARRLARLADVQVLLKAGLDLAAAAHAGRDPRAPETDAVLAAVARGESALPVPPTAAPDGAPVFAPTNHYPYDPANPVFDTVNTVGRVGANPATIAWLNAHACVVPVVPSTRDDRNDPAALTPSERIHRNDVRRVGDLHDAEPGAVPEEALRGLVDDRARRTYCVGIDADGFAGILRRPDGTYPDPDGAADDFEGCAVVQPETIAFDGDRPPPTPGRPLYVRIPAYRHAGDHVHGPFHAHPTHVHSAAMAVASALGGARELRCHVSRRLQRDPWTERHDRATGQTYGPFIPVPVHAALIGAALTGTPTRILLGDPDVQGRTPDDVKDARHGQPVLPRAELAARRRDQVNTWHPDLTDGHEPAADPSGLALLDRARTYVRAWHLERDVLPEATAPGPPPAFGNPGYARRRALATRRDDAPALRAIGYLGNDPAEARAIAEALTRDVPAADPARLAAQLRDDGFDLRVPPGTPALADTPWARDASLAECSLVVIGRIDPQADPHLCHQLTALRRTPAAYLGQPQPFHLPGTALVYGADPDVARQLAIDPPPIRTVDLDPGGWADDRRRLIHRLLEGEQPCSPRAGALCTPPDAARPPTLPYPEPGRSEPFEQALRGAIEQRDAAPPAILPITDFDPGPAYAPPPRAPRRQETGISA